MQPKKQVVHLDRQEKTREQERREFLEISGLGNATVHPLRRDSSIRNFYRVAQGHKTSILMDAQPPMEDTAKFEIMQKKFAAIGMTVPDIYATDHTHGLVLMEDFGDERYYELVVGGETDTHALYGIAVDALVHKFSADPHVALADSEAYSDEYWMFRVEQFLRHYMPHVMRRAATPTERDDFLGLFREAITTAHKFNPVLLHGDFGAQNLYYKPERSGIKALAMIDFQDATDARGNMMGSPAFDLVFLLQDVRVDLPQGLETDMRARFIAKTGIKDVYDFESVYATIGLAQATKCLGLFARLGHGDGRKEYLPFLSYCWRNVERNLAHPDLVRIKTWFETIKKG